MPLHPEDGMRLAVVTNLFPNPLDSNRSPFNERQITALAAQVPLCVVAPVAWVDFVRMSSPRRRVTRCLDWHGVSVRYPLYWYVPRVLGWIRGWLMAASIGPALLACVRRQRTTAILATWIFPDAYAAGVWARLLGLPLYVKVHGTDVAALAHKGLRRTLALRGLHRATGIISVSRYLRDRLVEQGVPADRITIVYNGVDAKLFRLRDRLEARRALGYAGSGRILLFVGALKVAKGVRELLDPGVLDACRQHGVRMWVVGQGPLQSWAEHAIGQARAGDIVSLMGPQAPSQIAELMAAADGLCLPSHQEGIPNVILEALSCGLPAIATPVGGIPEILDSRNGVLVECRNPPSLARGIAEFFSRDWRRDEVRATSRAATWEASAAALRAALHPAEEKR